MNRRFFSIVTSGIFCVCAGAADQYSMTDYESFRAMQHFADAHFSLIELLNARFSYKSKKHEHRAPAAYWLQDARQSEPSASQILFVERGLLFDPKTNTLYSKFGAWRFSQEKMYKVAQCKGIPQMPRSDVWAAFGKKLISTYHIEMKKVPELPGLYMICQYYGTALPGVIATVLPVKQFYRFSSSRMQGSVYDAIANEYVYDAADAEEVLIYVDGTLTTQRAPFVKNEHILATWREMMLRYQDDKALEASVIPRRSESTNF